MGVRMMVEIFDHWQDAGLTVGERSDLLVLAENANDGTRLTFGPVHEEYILRRAGKAAESWRVAISKLTRKGVLEHATQNGRKVRGHTGQYAVYRLVPLCPDPPHSGYKGHCTKPAAASGDGREGHLSDDPLPRQGYPADNPVDRGAPEEGYPAATPSDPSDNPVDREGYPGATDCVSSQITPTPLYPSSKDPSTTSSSLAEASPDAPPATDAEVTEGGGGGSLSSRAIAEEITAALDYRGKPPDKRQRQTIADRLAAALGSGWSVDGLALYLDLGDAPVNSPAAVYAARLAPDRLPDAVPVPAPRLSGGVRDPLPTSEEYANLTIDDVLGGGRPTGGTWEQATARARQRTGGGSGNGGTDDRVRGWVELSRQLAAKERHQPYSNDAWSRPADPATNTIPHCGDWDCDPINRMRDFDVGNGLKSCSPCTKCHPSMQF